MRFFQKSILLIFVVTFISVVQTYAGDNKYSIAVSSGQFDILDVDEPSFEGRVELLYYNDEIVNPFGGLMVNSDGGVFLFAGLFCHYIFFHSQCDDFLFDEIVQQLIGLQPLSH